MVRSVPETSSHATALWLLAGLDPTGGAGILRDTFTAGACAPSVPVARVVTAWTRQGHGRPASAEPRSAAAVIRELRSMPPPRAIKIGLLPAALVEAVLDEVASRRVPVVIDPVLAASDGGDLGARADILRDCLRDMSEETWLVTPNRHEAAALTGSTEDDPELDQRTADALGRAGVLLKSAVVGHERVRDIACLPGQVHVFERPRVAGPDPRGTGCALATAIACGLAQGRHMLAAISAAVAWLDVVRTRCVPGIDGRVHLPERAPPLA
ncbi:bifunctional hydroxymethylpyrimidine kinase/phosphomethylpyrimidine kinase [Nannocystis bainbridge]|uniref:Bifunctional hydroxymethylpyrimidine kinase/phosphomethylpyrimidine kinase n=1 Tax=Nannocystis bainbridge TaxID=2995303 RepID=A0ABT5DWF8_9BACT|nr:bifunctional hydroxymethylpyrimidine kinase/phosphomethylpyrimidine kinase [Nannocystis bainbridge]MDC0717974.1 bifunctional hydroxymethylpyrimidine kinase/phosphomethylpyrimidine kinase [Nannocystis bainbridge]